MSARTVSALFIHCYSPFFGSPALGTHIMSVLFSETEGLWTRERKRDHHMTLGQDSSSHSRSVYLWFEERCAEKSSQRKQWLKKCVAHLHLNDNLILPLFNGPFYSLKKAGVNQTLRYFPAQGLEHSRDLNVHWEYEQVDAFIPQLWHSRNWGVSTLSLPGGMVNIHVGKTDNLRCWEREDHMAQTSFLWESYFTPNHIKFLALESWVLSHSGVTHLEET